MKRTLEDIRENLDFVGCDNETALEMCDEIERLSNVLRRCREYLTQWDAVACPACKNAFDER